MTACAARKDVVVPAKTRVVPANAGTHNHRWLLFGTLLPQMADTFRITETEGMGPRLRGDDGEKAVHIALPFGQASSLPANAFA
jgi:hypothetical protein